MAIVYVGGNTGTWAGATAGNNNVSLTALTGGAAAAAVAGDFVVAVYATGSAANRTLIIQDPSAVAYSLIDVERYANGTTYDSNLRVAFKRLSAADANVVFGPTGNAQDAGAAAIHVWRGVDSVTPQDVTAVGTSGTGTGRPNPPAIAPTTAGSEVIVAGGAAAGTGAVFVGTGLANFRTATSVDTNDAMVGIGSFDWVSGTYDPAAWTGGTANAADSWTSITLALRPGATQTLTPALYTNTQEFFSPEVTQEGAAQTLTPSLYSNDQTFHSPTVSASYDLTPALYSNGQTFYSADITQSGGTQTLTPALYTNTQDFFAPSVAASYTLSPAQYTNAQEFFAPTATATKALQPALNTNTPEFFSPTVTAAYAITPGLYSNEQTFYAATLNTSVTLTPARYDNDQTFYSALITQTGGPQTLLPNLYSNEQTFFEPTVGRSAVTLQPELVANSQAFYAATAAASYALAPSLVTNDQAFYAPTVTQASVGQTLAPDLVTNAQTIYSATVTPGTVTLAVQGFVDDGYVSPGYVGPNTHSTQAFPPATVTPGPITLQPDLLSNAGQFFAPLVELQSQVITRAQAQLLRRIHALHGLAAAPLVVGPSARSAGDITQTISQAGQSVTIATTAADNVLLADVGQMIEELAALHGITAPLTVTPTSRTAGTIVQSLATVGSVTTVTRQ